MGCKGRCKQEGSCAQVISRAWVYPGRFAFELVFPMALAGKMDAVGFFTVPYGFAFIGLLAFYSDTSALRYLKEELQAAKASGFGWWSYGGVVETFSVVEP